MAIKVDFLFALQSFLPYNFAQVLRWWEECKPHQIESSRANKGWACIHPRQPQPSKTKIMTEEIREVADLITANIINTSKEVLTSDEAARYMGISKSYLYKLTMGQKIPHYKPMGKMCYFNRQEVEEWLQSNRIATEAEISQQAQTYCMEKGGKR